MLKSIITIYFVFGSNNVSITYFCLYMVYQFSLDCSLTTVWQQLIPTSIVFYVFVHISARLVYAYVYLQPYSLHPCRHGLDATKFNFVLPLAYTKFSCISFPSCHLNFACEARRPYVNTFSGKYWTITIKLLCTFDLMSTRVSIFY